MFLALLPHGTAPAAVQGVAARVERPAPESLQITYALDGSLAQLRIPAPLPPRPGTDLWQHTCFEIFIAERGMPAYHEFNFSPSGEWAAYSFSAYRRAAPLAAPGESPRISVRRTAGRLQLDVALRLDAPLAAAGALVAGIAAVIEDASGALSYWALHHPAGKPDFHRAETFTYGIDAIRN